MNAASSRCVDQIATQKLIAEKLSRVHHAPRGALRGAADPDDLAHLPAAGEQEAAWEPGAAAYALPSPVQTPYAENNLIRCRHYPAADALGEVVFVHGLYEDNLQIYNALIAMLHEHGLGVHLLILPYHYERRPAQSAFSGEYFWSADVERSALAYRQAVYDLLQVYRYVRRGAGRPVWIVGFSMGGGVALTLSALAALDGVFAVNPVCNLQDLVWHRPLCATVKADLEAHGVRLEEIQARYRAYDPLERGPGATPVSRIVLAKGLYDGINDPANYDLLIARWGLQQVIDYKAGHLNILRVPKLAADVAACAARSRQAALAAEDIALRGMR